jgi:hypothetical protein
MQLHYLRCLAPLAFVRTINELVNALFCIPRTLHRRRLQATLLDYLQPPTDSQCCSNVQQLGLTMFHVLHSQSLCLCKPPRCIWLCSWLLLWHPVSQAVRRTMCPAAASPANPHSCAATTAVPAAAHTGIHLSHVVPSNLLSYQEPGIITLLLLRLASIVACQMDAD